MRGERAFARARFGTVVLGIVLALTMTMLSACDINTAASQIQGNVADTPPEVIEAGADGEALTYWAELNGNAAGIKPTFQEVPFSKNGKRRRGEAALHSASPEPGEGRH